MATTITGTNSFDPASGTYVYGDNAVGAATVDGGSTLVAPAGTTTGDAIVFFGSGPAGDGTLTVTGAGSTVSTNASGQSQLLIGTGGGNGTVDLTAGATADIRADGFAFLGGGFDGGTATMNVDASTVNLASATSDSGMNLGFNGTSFAMGITNGSTVNITSQAATGDLGTFFNIGRFGSTTTASLSLSQSTLTMQADAQGGYAVMSVGRDGATGSLSLDGSTLGITALGGDAGMSVGRSGSTGSADITGGSNVTFSSASATDDRGAFLNVGRDGGAAGTMSVVGSSLMLEATGAAGYSILNVGRQGAMGTLSLDGADLDITGNGASLLRAGFARGTGVSSDGTINIVNGTTVDMDGDTASAIIGYDTDGVGTMNVLSGSVVNLNGTSTTEQFGLAVAGREGGSTGQVTISGTGSAVNTNGGFRVGLDPVMNPGMTSDGTLTVINQGSLEAGVGGLVGAGGALVLGQSSVDVAGGLSVNGGTLRILDDGTASITGGVFVENGSIVEFEVDATGNAGTIAHTGPLFGAGADAELRIVTASGFTFTAGESLRLLTSTGEIDIDITAEDVTAGGLGSALGYALGRTAQGAGQAVDFDVIDSATGTVAFGTTSTTGAVLNVGDDGADGEGGVYLGLITDGVSRFSGTAATDIFTSTATTGVVFLGEGGNDSLTGGTGDDTLNGGAGNDTLRGGAGNNVMSGGAGTDEYFVDSAGDTVVEFANQGTQDSVIASVNFALGAHVENLSLTGTANLRAIGNSTANIIQGNSGNNALYGNGGNDRIEGGAGNDRMDGGFGSDMLFGGAGNDLYVVDTSGDMVTEFAGQGTDFVFASTTYALGAHLENLLLTGTNNLIGIGNSVGNVIIGNSGVNALYGNGGNDLIRGEGGNDRLDGGFGNDRMIGGTGNDTYVVDAFGDQTVEAAGGGTDRVIASVNHTLQAEVENLSLVGTAGNGQGNAGGNVIIGNSGSNGLFGNGGNDVLRGEAGDDFLFGGDGNDRIIGGTGEDVLRGEAGADVFVFTPGSAAGTRDRIADFADGTDRIDIVGFGVTNGAGANDWLGATSSVVNAGGGVTITWNDGSELLVTGIVAAQLTDADFIL